MSFMNRLANAKNQFQTNERRVLTVCSAGLLRSPTAANVLHQAYGYNTRACGANTEFALVPLDEVLAFWADEIVFVEPSVYALARPLLEQCRFDGDIKILNVPDRYEWNSPDLRLIIETQYAEAEFLDSEAIKIQDDES